MAFDLTWQPLDESGLDGTFTAALAGKPVGPASYALASRWALRRLFKSISDAYKRAALALLRDEPGFEPAVYVWGRPYFILHAEPEAAVDALVELETLRDAESIMQLFYREMSGSFRRRRDEVDALARSEWDEAKAAVSEGEVMAEFRALVQRVEAACMAAEGSGKVRATMTAEVRRRRTEQFARRAEPSPLEGLQSRGSHAAQLIASSELLSYSAAVWMSKIGPCWLQNNLTHTLTELCSIYPAVAALSLPPSDLFDGVHQRFPHVTAAMAQRLDNNYSAGRYIPAQDMAKFIAWWRDHRAEFSDGQFAASPRLYQQVLEAALYARIKNWSLIEASDVIMPFTERLP